MYYRSKNTNPNWFGIFTEQIEKGEDPDLVIDELAELACGIKYGGASDMCQKYAKHIRTHLLAAFKAGEAYNALEKKQEVNTLPSNLNNPYPQGTRYGLIKMENLKNG